MEKVDKSMLVCLAVAAGYITYECIRAIFSTGETVYGVAGVFTLSAFIVLVQEIFKRK